MIRSAVVSAAALAAATLPGGSIGAAPPSLPSASIVFVRGDDLWLATPAGTSLRRLARRATQPAVSSDGRRIAFVRSRSIWVMERDGSGQTRLTSGHEDWTPAWSPDGETIYFSRAQEGEDESGGYEFAWPLYRMRDDGSAVQQLTHPTASDHGECDESPTVSADGRVVAYASIGECDRGNDVTVLAIDPVGKPVSLRGYDLRASGFDPAWSRIGRDLAFASVSDDWGTPNGIALASPGSRAQRVYRRGASDPAWSPDGRWIAFVRGVRKGTIWLVRRDGTGLRRFSSRRYDADPAWLPATR